MSDTTQAGASRLVAELLDRSRAPVLAGMRRALDRPGVAHVRYMRYHLGWEDAEGRPTDAGAGKMLRPALCLLCCEAVGGDAADVLPAAVAIELLHNFTLIHDDIEDHSEMRHGRSTLWRIAGIEQAINAGDGLFVLAQRTLLDLTEAGQSAERVVEAARLLNDACIALCEGQHADLAFERREHVGRGEYEAMIGGKTSALLGAAAAIGALCGGANGDVIGQFARFGLALGLGFQIQDDVLGIWGQPDQTGKSTADDIRARKKSFPVVYALEQLTGGDREVLAQRYARPSDGEEDVAAVLRLLDAAGAREASMAAARAWSDTALGALDGLDLVADRRAELAALASFVVERTG